MHFRSGDGFGSDVLALAQGIERNRAASGGENDASQVIVVTRREFLSSDGKQTERAVPRPGSQWLQILSGLNEFQENFLHNRGKASPRETLAARLLTLLSHQNQ